jgi:DNA-binding PadR family transcriptional regulator
MPRELSRYTVQESKRSVFTSTHHTNRRHHRDPRRRGDHHPFGPRELFGRGGLARPGVRRGEIRPLILSVLTKRPMHGYEVIQELEATSGGRWRPSAGSVYPTLQQLADEGLVTSEEVDGRRVYALTDSGRAAAEAAPSPRWGTDDDDGDDIRRFFAAVMQVERVGSPEARRESHRILADARRELYRLLAEDDAATAPSADTAGDAATAEDATPDAD